MSSKAKPKPYVKSAARFFAVQALFQMEASNETVDKVRVEFENHRFGEDFEDHQMSEADPKLFRRLLETAIEQQAKIDQLTDRGLVAKWPIARIDPTLRALFRAAGAELINQKTPPRVVIKEFVDIAGAFFPDGDEVRFTNAVLDHMAHETHTDQLR